MTGNRLVVGSVASGWNTANRKGDINVIVYDFDTAKAAEIELHNQLQLDDHDAPGLLVRPDGRVLAVYAKHDNEDRIYSRLSQSADALTWAAEQSFSPSASTKTTYANVFQLSAEGGKVYDFYRGLDNSFKPSYAYSTNGGQSWTSGNIVINVPSTERHRPYVVYTSNNVDTIHLVYTEAHPRDYDNSLYHVYYKGGTLYRSNGTAIAPLSQGIASPSDGTRIFQGSAQNVAWNSDVVLDAQGYPVVAYSVQVGSAGLPTGQGGTDIRYRYARWDGTAWRDHPLAYAGTRLYSGEDDYSGLATPDPANPSIVYISTNANPTTGAALMSTADGKRHYEIFKAVTSDGGATWAFTAVTRNSTQDNLRPLMPAGADAHRKTLLWLRGTYRSYTDYQQQVVMLSWRE